MNSLIESLLRVFRQRDRSQSQRRAAEEERRVAVEEALDELLASDTHYRKELNSQIATRIATAEGKRRARTQELKEVCRQSSKRPKLALGCEKYLPLSTSLYVRNWTSDQEYCNNPTKIFNF